MGKALDYIEANIFAPLSTASIATGVGFSEYHFQRIFTSVLGDSPANYVRKRRLSEAALQLRNSKCSIEDIAFNCQFGSKEAFTRSFSQMFKLTPGAYRQRGPSQQPLLTPKVDLSTILSLRQGNASTPAIIERCAEYAVGMAACFVPSSFLQIHALWNQFLPRINEIETAKPDYQLGIRSFSHPLVETKSADSFVYAAAVPVNSIAQVPEGMVPWELSSGRYAVFTHRGKLSDLQHTVDYIWGIWVPSMANKLRDVPDFELYDQRFNPESLDGEIDIYMPIV